ncbi:MAG: type II toxin-antitoxin system VapC family toxin [Marinagarivorans sp.]|nr:type II toxin-antitoxin system VapC family toxin [Marinagarivorans sp.]
MYLIDTNVISELRKKSKMNPGVKAFFKQAELDQSELYLSAITLGELRRGVELIRHRGDITQASLIEKWLNTMLEEFEQNILPFGREEAQVWGKLRSPHPENALDKQIAATAIIYGMGVVTRNRDDFVGTGVTVINPFT